MEINIHDYLSQDEIKSICEQELRTTIRSQLNKEANTQFSNIIYRTAYNVIDEVFRENERDLRKELVDKFKKIISGLSSCDVFRKAYTPYDSISIGQMILDEEVVNARPLIQQKVEEVIDRYPFENICKDEISEIVYEAICDKLFGKEEN